jgi:glycosyltransferase involved in cell wall biosynthesis
MEQERSHCHQVIPSVELGGGDLVGLGLAAELHNRGQSSPVWVPTKGPTWERACVLGLTPNLFGAPAVFQHGRLRALLAQWRLGRRLRRQGPGLVHVHAALWYGLLSWGLRRCGLPRVVHVQIDVDDAGLRWALKRPPELILTCARFLVERVRRCLPEGVQPSQWIEAVPNTVDTQRFFPGDKDAAKSRLGAPPLPLVLMLANLAPHKGQETAVRAVAELRRRGIDVACWLAGKERGGGDTYTARLRAMIAELDVADRVRLLGFREDAPELLRAADYFLLPSTHEGLPLTVLEAQASKVPVLTSTTAGIPEAVQEGETGFLIAPDDAAGYADRIARLLEDAGLRGRVTEQAYARTTREYNWRNFCARVWDLYQELLARGGRWGGGGRAPGRTPATATEAGTLSG